jgi:hypothetical protein
MVGHVVHLSDPMGQTADRTAIGNYFLAGPVDRTRLVSRRANAWGEQLRLVAAVAVVDVGRMDGKWRFPAEGAAMESNHLTGGLLRPAGFEVRGF